VTTPDPTSRLDDPHYPALTMSQAAELLGVQAAFLRSLDGSGVLQPFRSAGGHRRYSRHQLALAARVRTLLDDGVGGGAHEGPLGIRWWGSGTHEAGDGLGGLADLLLGLPAAGARGLDDAVAEVLLEQAEGDSLERLRHRRDLGEDVDAVLLVLDHALQTAGLTLDATEPLEVLVLAVDVAVVVLVPGAMIELLGPNVGLRGVAERAGTIEYEVLTRIGGARLQRVYRGETA